MTVRAIGIDPATRALDAVVVETSSDRPAVVDATILLGIESQRLNELCAGAATIAIDAPSALSTAVHATDPAVRASYQFARCGEIALLEQLRIPVMFRTPADAGQLKGWMHTGFQIWDNLRSSGHEPIEVYPGGAFPRLSDARLRPKRTKEGVEDRLTILDRYLALPSTAEQWSHDTVDAAMAALIALWHSTNGPVDVAKHDESGCDGSAIWVPRLR